MGNAYNKLRALLPEKPLLVGTVTSTDGLVAKVQLPGGGVVRARGDAAAGARVFVRDGVIESTAPTLTTVIIDV
jgi:hypothetical protein